jgi:tol-pal system protein YbgF
VDRLHRHALQLVLALFLIGGGTAQAGLFSDDEARQGVSELRARLDQMQRTLDARLGTLETTLKSQGLVDLFTQVESLQEDLAKLRGQIEVMTNELESAQKRQRDLYVDLDSRLRRIESGGAASDATKLPTDTVPVVPTLPTVVPPAAVPATPAPPPPTRGDANAEQHAYDMPLDQFKAGNYGAAIVGFQSFVKTYPKSALAPSAQYWVGNAQYAQREFKEAIVSQRQLVHNYPESQKAPDALLNIASSQLELGDAKGARKTLDELVAKFPQSEAADKARKRLAGR